MTIPDSLKVLDTHIQTLHQQLIQHSMKMAATKDAQTHLLMAQQQTHMLEAQRLLLQNKQLMMAQAQMYGAQANAAQIIQNFVMAPQNQHKSTRVKNATTSKKTAYPNVMQQLTTPPLSQLSALNFSVNQTAASNLDPEEMPQQQSPHPGVPLKRYPSPHELGIKREVSPLDPLGVVQVMPRRDAPSPSFPPLAIKREVVTPPLKTREPSPIHTRSASSGPSPDQSNKTSSLRDILARPPRVAPPDVRLRAGNFRPVQTVSPFYQRPTAVVTASRHVGPAPTPEGRNERRGVPMTKIRISPPAMMGTMPRTVSLPDMPGDKFGTIVDKFVLSQTMETIGKGNFGGALSASTCPSSSVSASPPLVKAASTVQPVKPTVMNNPPWTQPNQKEPENDDDYAIRYATTPVKRRRRRPLGLTKKPYTKVCSLCKEEFYKADDYKDHMNKVHSGTFKVRVNIRMYVSQSSVFFFRSGFFPPGKVMKKNTIFCFYIDQKNNCLYCNLSQYPKSCNFFALLCSAY